MATPPDAAQQARNYHAEQALLAASAGRSVTRMLASGAPWVTVLSRWATFQLRAAALAVQTMSGWAGRSTPNVNPVPFAGVSSAGFALSEPLVATIDYRIPAPAEDIPAQWWNPSQVGDFAARVEQLIAAEVADAARSAAQAEMLTEPEWQNYVRVLVPPSCKRCVVLAGKIYRDLDGFERHPGCDCVHYPVQSWEEAHDAGLVSSPAEAYEKGMIRDLTVGERRAIDDGADITTVINSSSGIHSADIFGRSVKTTRYGTTKRSKWRKDNPQRLVRLRPEAIYRIVDEEYDGDRDEALRLLDAYGYLSETGRAQRAAGGSGAAGSGGGRPSQPAASDDENRGFGPPPSGSRGMPEFDAYWKRRQAALEGDRFSANGDTLEDHEVRSVERLLDNDESIKWIPKAASSPTYDFTWARRDDEPFELKSTSTAEAAVSAIAKDARKAARHPWASLIKTNYIVDFGEQVLTDDMLSTLADYNFVNGQPRRQYRIKELWVLAANGRQLTKVELRT